MIYVSDKGCTHGMSTRRSISIQEIPSKETELTHDDKTGTSYSGTTEEYSVSEDGSEEDDGAGSKATIDYSRKNKSKG